MPTLSAVRAVLALALVLATSAPAAVPAGPADPRTLAPDAVRREIEAGWTAVAAPGASLEIVRLPTLRLPSPGVTPTVVVAWPEAPLGPGPRAITISCLVAGRTVARGLANVRVRVERTVWVLARPQKRGEILDPEALVERRVTLDREPRPLFEPEKGRTWRLRRDVEAGARLRMHDLRPLPHVAAGTELDLVAGTREVRVVVPGRVRRGGDVGDVVLVLNPVTGALVEATLIDRRTAVLAGPGTKGTREGRKRT